MSELVLHIGTHKTATTTIQATLHDNRRRLAAEGLVYPRIGRDKGHHLLATPWIDLPPRYHDGTPAEAHWRRLAARHAAGAARVLISSEGFSRRRPKRVDFAELAAFAAPFGRRRVICYVRNQAEYVQSVYVQVLKRGRFVDFDGFIRPCLEDGQVGGLYLDYGALFDHVARGFAPEDIGFLAYEAGARHPGGIVQHLLDAVGGGIRLPPGRSSNVSPGPVALWAALQVSAPGAPSPELLAAAEAGVRTLAGEARATLYTRGQLARLAARLEPLNRAAEARMQAGSPGLALAPVRMEGRVVTRDELDVGWLLARLRGGPPRPPGPPAPARTALGRALAGLRRRLATPAGR